MERNGVLLLLIYLIGRTSSVPAVNKTLTEEPRSEPTAVEPKHDIFSTIIKVNQGIETPMVSIDIKIRHGRGPTFCTTCVWPKSADGSVIIPYALSPVYSDSQANLLLTSMQEFETLTCIKFIPWTTEKDYIYFVSSQGCSSYLGRLGGNQTVGVDIHGCLSRGIIQHELNHVLGINHEHTRFDRDNYVDIFLQYISPENTVNFLIHNDDTLGVEYDYGSVMHIDKYAFSNTSNQPSILPKPDPTVPIGQRSGLSILDIKRINRLYECNVSVNLLNNINGTVTSANYPDFYPNDVNSLWLIRTPYGQVSLDFEDFDIQLSSDCEHDYIKIYDGPSKKSPVLLGKTCGTRLIPRIVASTNQMLVEFVSDCNITGGGFKASYKLVPCGGNFMFEGNITSPGFPDAYPPGLDCVFNILAPKGYRISLTVNEFNTEGEELHDCMYDYMKVLCRNDTYGPFCGDHKVPPIISSGRSLVLIFHSDESTQGKGFHASYSFI